MGWPRPADIRLKRVLTLDRRKALIPGDMCALSLTWKCPGCGGAVVLPEDLRMDFGRSDNRRLDQLAQALCGCWVAKLPDKGLARLLRSILTGDDTCYEDWCVGAPGGR